MAVLVVALMVREEMELFIRETELVGKGKKAVMDLMVVRDMAVVAAVVA